MRQGQRRFPGQRDRRAALLQLHGQCIDARQILLLQGALRRTMGHAARLIRQWDRASRIARRDRPLAAQGGRRKGGHLVTQGQGCADPRQIAPRIGEGQNSPQVGRRGKAAEGDLGLDHGAAL